MAAIDALQNLQNDLIRKTLNGSVFVAPYSAGTVDETDLFDDTTWDLQAGGLPAEYEDLGYLTDAGAQFARSVNQSDVTSWQSLTPTRSDMTSDVTTLQVACQETKLTTIGLGVGVETSGITPGSNGLRIDQPSTPIAQFYRVISIAVDEQDDGEFVIARYLPRAQVTGYDNQNFSKGDDPVLWSVTFTGRVDDTLGTPGSFLFGGAGFKARLTSMGFQHTITGSTTSSSPNLVATTGTFSPSDVGKPVAGAGIPAGATIITYTDSTHAVMSANATATASGVTITIG